MEPLHISNQGASAYVAPSLVGLDLRSKPMRGLGVNWQLPFLQRVVNMIKTIIAPLFVTRTVRYFHCEDLRKLPNLNGNPAVHVESYDGVSAVPDEVADVIEPLPGETLSVLFVGRKIAGFVRAAFKSQYSPELDQFIEVSAGEVLLYQTYLMPEYNSLNMYAYLFMAAARGFLEKGFSRVIIATPSANPVLKRAIEKAGFRLFKTEKNYRILGKHFHSVEHLTNGHVLASAKN